MSAMKKGETPQVASQIKKKEMMSDIGFWLSYYNNWVNNLAVI
jgi:hypothetical protein